MELKIREYDKEIKINYGLKTVDVEGKAVLKIRETYEPESIFHEEFFKYELLEMEIKSIEVFNEQGLVAKELTEEQKTALFEIYQMNVEAADSKYI